MPTSPPPRVSGLAKHAALLVVIATLVLTSFVRLRLADVPLERDEGEYVYAGQLILQGVPPYELAANMKFPGTYYAYAAILAVFGQSSWGIHAGLIVVNILTTLMVFFLGRRLIDGGAGFSPPNAGAAAGAAIFAVLSLDRWTNGVFAHATHFVLLPAMAGLLRLHIVMGRAQARSLWSAGALLGLAIAMKQPGVCFLMLAAGLVLWHDVRRFAGSKDPASRKQPASSVGSLIARQAWLFAGATLPFVLLGALFAMQGVLGKAWFWTFQYARAYVSEMTLSQGLAQLVYAWAYITQATWALWLLAALGLVMLRVVRWPAEARVWLTGLALAGAVGVMPGFYFRPHYFILLLPAAALLAGVAVASAKRLIALALPRPLASLAAAALVLAAVTTYGLLEHRYLFSMTPSDLSREMYGANPFVEAPEIGRYVEQHSSPDDRIAVLGSEPEIYFYARRHSATEQLYVYPLFEPQPFAQRMEDEMIQQIEAAQPLYLVHAAVSSSWTTPDRAGVDRRIRQWADDFARACYDVVGVADIGQTHTTMVWDADAAAYRATNENVVYTLRRKGAVPCRVAGSARVIR